MEDDINAHYNTMDKLIVETVDETTTDNATNLPTQVMMKTLTMKMKQIWSQ